MKLIEYVTIYAFLGPPGPGPLCLASKTSFGVHVQNQFNSMLTNLVIKNQSSLRKISTKCYTMLGQDIK